MAPGHYASSWRVAEHADVSLILATRAAVRTASGEEPAGRPARKKRKTEPHAPSVAELPEGQQLPAHRLVLATHSAFFRTLLATDVPSSRTAALKDASGNRLLVVELEDEEEVQAGEAVLEIMYVEEVPAARRSDPSQLAVMCSVADRWQASSCLRLAFGALAALGADALSAEVLADVLPRLPFGTSSLGDLAAELNAFTATVTTVLEDVHAVLTTPALLRLLLALPFEVMLAWAGSDGLVVDSENSVVVALDCWVREGHGRACSKEELRQLSGRVRVQQLTPAYQLRLLDLPWWRHSKQSTQLSIVEGLAGVRHGPSRETCPRGWRARARKQLPAATLQQRTTLALDVPRATLAEAFGDERPTRICSQPQYAAGYGLQVSIKVGEPEDGARPVTTAVRNASFACGGVAVLPRAAGPLVLQSYSVSLRAAPGRPARELMASTGVSVIGSALGSSHTWSAAAAAGLEPYLTNGHLGVVATMLPVRGAKQR